MFGGTNLSSKDSVITGYDLRAPNSFILIEMAYFYNS